MPTNKNTTRKRKAQSCVHEFEEIDRETAKAAGARYLFATDHVWRCTKCGEIQIWDSSD